MESKVVNINKTGLKTGIKTLVTVRAVVQISPEYNIYDRHITCPLDNLIDRKLEINSVIFLNRILFPYLREYYRPLQWFAISPNYWPRSLHCSLSLHKPIPHITPEETLRFLHSSNKTTSIFFSVLWFTSTCTEVPLNVTVIHVIVQKLPATTATYVRLIDFAILYRN